MKKFRLLVLMLLGILILSGCSKKINDLENETDLYSLYSAEGHNVLNSSPLKRTLIASRYVHGEEFEAPAVKLTNNGKEYNAKSYIKFPSGKITENTKIILKEIGEYEVIYLAAADDKILSDTYTFTVVNELYSVLGSQSTAYYGTHDYMPGVKGIVTSIRPSESFIYNKPIDISNYGKEDKIVTINVLPTNIGVSDTDKIIITLTDIYDPNNFITVELKKFNSNEAWAVHATYVVAYGNGQSPCGLEEGSFPNNGRVVEYKGQQYTIHENDSFGAAIRFAMNGAPRYVSTENPNYDQKYVGEQEFSLAMDYKNGVLYSGDGVIINDLRSDIIYGSNFWTGFTTGECYLSVSGLNYVSPSLNLIVKEIGNESTSNMSENLYADNDGPNLNILWNEEYPIGLIGHKYPIFEAESYDDYDREAKEVEVSVVVNYGLSNEVVIPVVDGYFIPKYKTTYYICYKSRDVSGNESEIIIPVEVQDNVDQVYVKEVSESLKTVDIGNEIVVSDLIYDNVIGKIEEKITATLISDPSIKYDVIDKKFVPLYAGKYEIKYEFNDYLFDGEYTYEISANSSDFPVILSKIELEKYYIVGYEYTLPTYSGYVFENGKPVEKLLDVYITQGSEVKKIEGFKFAPTNEGDVIISYVLSNGNLETRKDIQVKVVDTGYTTNLEMGKYFYSDNVEIIAEAKYIEYSFVENKDTTLEFIKTLSSNVFSIRLSATEGKDNFSRINLYLTDAEDERIKVKLTYEKTLDGYVKFYINDSTSRDLKTFFASSSNPIIFEYDNELCQVSPQPNNYLLIEETLYGEKFDGFVSENIKLTIEAENVTGKSSLRIVNLCGQSFTKIKADIIEPVVNVNNDVNEFQLNTIYTLPKVTIFDVLDLNVKASITMKDPNGQIVTTIDGAVLEKNELYNFEHSVKLDNYGTYQILYEAYDSSGNMTQYNFVVSVVDSEAPVVTLLDSVTEGKKGEQIAISRIGITDNVSKEFNVYVCVITPNGVIYTLTKDIDDIAVVSKTFTTNEAGKYTICYFVSDDAGNSTYVSYVVNVS